MDVISHAEARRHLVGRFQRRKVEQSRYKVGSIPAVRSTAEAMIAVIDFQAGGAVKMKGTAGKPLAHVQSVEAGGVNERDGGLDRFKDVHRPLTR